MPPFRGAPFRRKFNQAIVEAELAGKTRYAGKPCDRNPAHVSEDGTTLRDTIKRTCLECYREFESTRGRYEDHG